MTPSPDPDTAPGLYLEASNAHGHAEDQLRNARNLLSKNRLTLTDLRIAMGHISAAGGILLGVTFEASEEEAEHLDAAHDSCQAAWKALMRHHIHAVYESPGSVDDTPDLLEQALDYVRDAMAAMEAMDHA